MRLFCITGTLLAQSVREKYVKYDKAAYIVNEGIYLLMFRFADDERCYG
jgi:hypothetical protein